MVKLRRKFFARNTLVVARELLGKILCRRYGDIIHKGRIVEVEAYTQEDPACHAFNGITKRNKSLFEKPGTAYVYFTYGMHYCLNLVTDREAYASGVLIRALEPIQNLDNTNGPARLTKAMNINKHQDGLDVTIRNSDIWIEDAENIIDKNIVQTVRIGVSKAVDYPYRFYIKENKWVSKV